MALPCDNVQRSSAMPVSRASLGALGQQELDRFPVGLPGRYVQRGLALVLGIDVGAVVKRLLDPLSVVQAGGLVEWREAGRVPLYM